MTVSNNSLDKKPSAIRQEFASIPVRSNDSSIGSSITSSSSSIGSSITSKSGIISNNSKNDQRINQEKQQKQIEFLTANIAEQDKKELLSSFIECVFDTRVCVFDDDSLKSLSKASYDNQIKKLISKLAQDPPPVRSIEFSKKIRGEEKT